VLRSYLMPLMHLSVCNYFSFLFLIIISCLFAETSQSICTLCFHNVISSCSHTGLRTCKYQLPGTSIPSSLHIEWYACKLYHVLS
jgi:hypothetical protein